MYLRLQPFLEFGPNVSDLFAAALTSPQAVTGLLTSRARDDLHLRRLQQLNQVGPIFLDLWGTDMQLSEEDVGRIVQAIRDHWHHHGFCIARCNSLERWIHAAFSHHQPLLYWRGLDLRAGWNLLGIQLRAIDLDVFRYLLDSGTATIEEVARDPCLFSQRPRFSNWRVQRDIATGYRPQGPIEFNRSEAQRILTRMYQQRLVTRQQGFYHVVRPTRDNGV